MTPPPRWKPAQATVTSVEPRHGLSRTLETEDNPGRDYFVIHFRYMADGQTYGGNFESRTPLEPESIFEILYNLADPQQNTRSEPIPGRINRIIFWVIVALFVGLIVYLAIAVK